MDGNQRTIRISTAVRRGIVCAGLAVTLLGLMPAAAQAPLQFCVQGATQPLSIISESRRTSSRSDLAPPRVVRPPARVLRQVAPMPEAAKPLHRPPTSASAGPTPDFAATPATVPTRSGPAGSDAMLVRPPARLIVAESNPTVTVLAGTEDVPDVDVAPLTHPTVNVGRSSGSRPVTVERALETRGSVSFRKTPIAEVVFLLSDIWHINIVASENVTGEVSGAFHDAPLREVLSAALAATGYSYRQTGNSLVVLPVDQVGSDDPDFSSETIRLPPSLSQDPSTLQAAELLLSDRGRLQRVGDSAVLVVDTAQRIARIRQLFSDLSPATGGPAAAGDPRAGVHDLAVAPPLQSTAVVQSGIAYFTPQFTEAEEMATPLQSALGEEVIVAVYPEENRIMVRGNADDLRLASQAVEQLDKPRPQVRISAMIYDVGLAELENLGINWTRDLRAIANSQNEALEDVTTSVEELFAFTSDLTTSGVTRIGIETLTDKIGAGVFLELLDSNSEAKLLADPSITVGDRRQASIRIVRKIPIVGANPVENSNAVFTQTEFEEAGVILNVTPRISRDGTIELQVQPEYSVVAEITSIGPVIDSRQADTTVRVSNGQMFVLGGLRQKSVIESVRGIPYLKDIKHVGRLFRSHNTEVRESELIVFLKPELITPYWPGLPREQRAACVSTQQLDAIPHAEAAPMIPCCKDPHCPNHHPRPRINGGSRSLGPPDYYGGISSPHAMGVQIVDEIYPPIHIDSRVLTTIEEGQ